MRLHEKSTRRGIGYAGIAFVALALITVISMRRLAKT